MEFLVAILVVHVVGLGGRCDFNVIDQVGHDVEQVLQFVGREEDDRFGPQRVVVDWSLVGLVRRKYAQR